MVAPVVYGGDEVSALVLDIGTQTTRAGYAGTDSPSLVMPTAYAALPSTADAPDASTKDTYPSPYVYRSPLHTVQSPLVDGCIVDWAATERLVEHVFRNGMRLAYPSVGDKEKEGEQEGGLLDDFPVLVSESCWTPKEGREKLCEIIMEGNGASGYYSADKATLSAFASGRGTALIVDIGEDVTSITPVFDGFVIRKAIQKQPIAGSTISSILLSYLRNNKPPIDIIPQYLVQSKTPVEPDQPAKAILRKDRLPYPLANPPMASESFARYQEMRLMQDFKESVCSVLDIPWDQGGDQAVQQRPPKHFEFPNGFNTSFGFQRYAIPEALFDPRRFLPKEFNAVTLPPSPAVLPSKPYAQCVGIPEMITESLGLCDPDTQMLLVQNIVLTGGTTLMPGLADRIQNEMNVRISGTKPKIHAPSSALERKYAPWLGGSILASLGTFHQLWIGREEYMEIGRSVVHRRAK